MALREHSDYKPPPFLIAGGITLELTAAGVIALQYRGARNAARERLSAIHTAQVETRHGPMEYVLSGTGPPFLMIHGSGDGFDQALAMGRRLTDFGYRLIAPSRFGYLGTPMPAASHPAQADALADLLDELGIERVAVVGGSAGTVPAILH